MKGIITSVLLIFSLSFGYTYETSSDFMGVITSRGFQKLIKSSLDKIGANSEGRLKLKLGGKKDTDFMPSVPSSFRFDLEPLFEDEERIPFPLPMMNLKWTEAFPVEIRLNEVEFEGDISITNPLFRAEPGAENLDGLRVSFDIEVADYAVKIPNLKFKELGFSRPNNESSCQSSPGDEGGIWFEVKGLKVGRRDGGSPLRSRMTFLFKKKSNKTDIKLDRVQTNLVDPGGAPLHIPYSFNEIILPDLRWGWVNGECQELDTSGISKLIHKKREIIMNQVLLTSQQKISDLVISKVNESLESFSIKPSYGKILNKYLFIPFPKTAITSSIENISPLENYMSSVLFEFNLDLSVGKYRGEGERSLRQVRFLPDSYIPYDFGLGTSLDFINRHLDLMATLFEDKDSKLQLGEKGVKLEVDHNGRFFVIADILVELQKSEKFIEKYLAYYYEKLFGDTKGTIRFPVKVEVIPGLETIKGETFLTFEMKSPLENNHLIPVEGEFNSNISDASGLVRGQLLKKLERDFFALRDRFSKVPLFKLEKGAGVELVKLDVDEYGDIKFYFSWEDQTTLMKLIEVVK